MRVDRKKNTSGASSWEESSPSDRALGGGRDGRLRAAGPDERAVAAAAAFLTPVATPANLMVMGPGGYRFGDYWRLGLPMLVLFGVVAVLLEPVFWAL
jgi:hypothetical protein